MLLGESMWTWSLLCPFISSYMHCGILRCFLSDDVEHIFFFLHLFSIYGTVAHELACSLFFNLLTMFALPACCGNKFQKSADYWTILIFKKWSSVTVSGRSLVPLLWGLENNSSPIYVIHHLDDFADLDLLCP